MSAIDLNYTCRMLAGLSGMPVRLYHHDVRTGFFSPVRLPADPLILCEKEILKTEEQIGYYVTPEFLFYGYVRSKEDLLILGPTYQVLPSEALLRRIAFSADLSNDEASELVRSFRLIVSMPLESLLMVLCMISHILNGTKTELKEITIHESEQKEIKTATEKQRTEAVYDAVNENYPHNTLQLEETMTAMVEAGDPEALEELFSHVPSVRGGIIAGDQVRQLKNTFVVSATLVSRAAIRGGLDAETALSLSDAYIRRMELLASQEKITGLQYQMILEFAEQTEKIRHGQNPSPLALKVTNYIRQHLSEEITASMIADAFYLSRTWFSARFRKETGMTVTEFIRREKTDEAKRLLRYSDKSSSAISAYLGFSSHSYFIKVFRDCTGCTPNEYRRQNRGH